MPDTTRSTTGSSEAITMLGKDAEYLVPGLTRYASYHATRAESCQRLASAAATPDHLADAYRDAGAAHADIETAIETLRNAVEHGVRRTTRPDDDDAYVVRIRPTDIDADLELVRDALAGFDNHLRKHVGDPPTTDADDADIETLLVDTARYAAANHVDWEFVF